MRHMRAITKPAQAIGMVQQGVFLTVLEKLLNLVISQASESKGDKTLPTVE
ncbi:MAG: hypothetical protein AMXMBFR84_19580 [Candidatus Hydrogenedentota bacterium]